MQVAFQRALQPIGVRLALCEFSGHAPCGIVMGIPEAHAREGDAHHHREQKMTKQKQPQQNEQQQPNSQGGKNPDRQGGRNAPGQLSSVQPSQGQPGARQSDQGGRRSDQTANQKGIGSTIDESPEMNEADESNQSSERLRRGALDAQYGTDSSSKTGYQAARSEDTQSPTGSDRDTMGGARSKGR